jgi:thiol-disulfide isomerase/thioredoxin
MKRISTILILIFLLFSCGQEENKVLNTFTVSGTIEGLDTKYMSTSYTDESGNRISDSVFVKNNSFIYTAKITKPTHIVFWPNVERTIKRSGNGYYPAKSSQFSFLASPGDNITFNGKVTDFINAYPSGSAANDDLALINSSIFPLLNKSVNTLLRKGKLAKKDSLNIKVLDDSINALNDKVIRLKKEFLNINQNSEAALWYLSDMMMRSQVSDEEAIQVFKNIGFNLKENPYYKEVASRVRGIESTLIGKTIPDFTTKNTMDETEFKFSSLSGKYVIIDFWGTWCGPCVAEMPKLKEYQEKYNDQLVVLGINSGDTKEKIEKFITPKNYTWKQLLSGKGKESLVLKFNVAGFPTKFIIDPSGKILHRFEGGGEDSFAALDDLLSK